MIILCRLLHYFPINEDGERVVDSWCGWHNDHSALTGLVPNMYIENDTGKQVALISLVNIFITEIARVLMHCEVPSPDPDAGLYVRRRDNQIVKVLLLEMF